jgi:hypothetical protein
MLGLSWALLLAGTISAYLEQQRITRVMAVADERLSVESALAPEVAGVAAPWFVAAGFAALGVAALL